MQNFKSLSSIVLEEFDFEIFSKICNFVFFDIFEKKIKNTIANFVKMEIPVNRKCTNLIPKFQEDTIPQKAKKNSQSWQKRSQNFAFLDTLGYLVLVRPNDLRQLNQIWHTSSQCSGASSCKILDT